MYLTDREAAVSSKKKISESRLKLVFVIAAALIVAALIWILAVQITSGKGEKAAARTAEFIGSSLSSAEDELDIHFRDNSTFSIINNAAVFDYIYESDDKVQIDGAAYPEWTVTVMKSPSDYIETVEYTAYTVLKKDSRGKKTDERISLDKFNKGDKFSAVREDIDLDPYRITYAAGTVSYHYLYHYTDPAGDSRCTELIAVFDDNNKYLYYTSVDIYPQFI